MTTTRFIAIGYFCHELLDKYGHPSYALAPLQFVMTYSRHSQFYIATVVSINRMTAVMFPSRYEDVRNFFYPVIRSIDHWTLFFRSGNATSCRSSHLYSYCLSPQRGTSCPHRLCLRATRWEDWHWPMWSCCPTRGTLSPIWPWSLARAVALSYSLPPWQPTANCRDLNEAWGRRWERLKWIWCSWEWSILSAPCSWLQSRLAY